MNHKIEDGQYSLILSFCYALNQINMTTHFIAYTRVSTQKQGTQGVSLQEQRRAITRYAQKHKLIIASWYQEQNTAAKRGRVIFQDVLKKLEANDGKLGLLMHKIDRGARNLRDWADIGELIDSGIKVRFAHDDLDMHTRAGRLTADCLLYTSDAADD